MSYGGKRVRKGLPDKENSMQEAQRQERTHQVAPEKDEKGWDGGEMKLER